MFQPSPNPCFPVLAALRKSAAESSSADCSTEFQYKCIGVLSQTYQYGNSVLPSTTLGRVRLSRLGRDRTFRLLILSLTILECPNRELSGLVWYNFYGLHLVFRLFSGNHWSLFVLRPDMG